MYENNHEGKRSYVNDLLKPMLLFTGLGITNVEYLDKTSEKTRMYPETVLLTNANPEKSMSVNVSGDSISAMVCDVMKRVFGLDYARREEPQIEGYKNFEDIWKALRSCSTIHQFVKTIESLPRWSGDWDVKLTDHSVIAVNTYFDAMLNDTFEEEVELEFEDLVGEDTADYWPYTISVDRGDGDMSLLGYAPTERSAKQLASDLVEYFGEEIDAAEVKYRCEDLDDPSPLNDMLIAKFGC